METEERRREEGGGGGGCARGTQARVCQNKDSSRNKKQYQEEPGLNKRTMDNNGNCT